LNCSLLLSFNFNIIGDTGGKSRDTGHCQTTGSRITSDISHILFSVSGSDTLFRRVTYLCLRRSLWREFMFCLMNCDSFLFEDLLCKPLGALLLWMRSLNFSTARRPPAAADQCECGPWIWGMVGDIPARSVSAHGNFRLRSTRINALNIGYYGHY